MSNLAASIEWNGTERYDVRRCIGRGGTGVVYEVFDRERGQLVAAKTLQRSDPRGLYLFKQEFRTLAEVRHPNLVRFYEFVQRDGAEVFFTMELVDGVDFVSHARGIRALAWTAEASCERIAARTPAQGGYLSSEDVVAAAPAAGSVDPRRLRRMLLQLADAVCAVHEAGKLHRDIKPSNVLVTADDRVVLLDFGVSTELARPTATSCGAFIGTPAYVAPEQVGGDTVLAASDWYGVGVMLYEILAGRPPFEGSVDEVLNAKLNEDPPPPSQWSTDVPADLDDLCMALMNRDPRKRPDGAEVARRLGAVRNSAPPPRGGVEDRGAFIGRAAQYRVLSQAFEATRRGELVVVRVGGEAGMGKSALVERFLRDLEGRAGALVLRGRAYEREAVPYKAFDGVVDDLSAHLLALDEAGEPLDLPVDIDALAHLFPVLRDVPGIPAAAAQRVSDPRSVRGRAFAAHRELLASLAGRAPLVVFLDDVHRGDVDSATLLLDLMRPPAPAPILVVMTSRDGDADGSPFLRELRDRMPAGVAVRDVVVGPLDPQDAKSLARALLDGNDPRLKGVARAIARESRGSPFLIEELARSNRGQRSAEGATLPIVSLDEMVGERVDKLPEDARAVLRAVAVGGRPMPIAVVSAASGVASAEETIALLVSRRFARTGLRSRREIVEMSHDRIRETVVAQLDGDVLRATHRSLAEVLADAPGIDAEEVSEHWMGAGDVARAAHFAEKGADQAAAALAFDRAARLYRRTMDLSSPSSPDELRCRVRLAEALKYAGRSEESARTYLEAAEGSAPEQRIELRREAAHQLLGGGHLDKARDVLRDVLAAVGMRTPRSPWSALLWLVLYRFWLGIIGVRLRVLPEERVPPSRRLRIDAIYTVVGGFAIIDPMVSACMQARHMIEALRGADAYRLLRATAVELAHSLSRGAKESRRDRALFAAVESLSGRVGPQAVLVCDRVRSLTAFQRGRWPEARRLQEKLEALPYGVVGMATVRLYGVYTDYYMGEVRRAFERGRALLAQAEALGDLFTIVNLRTSNFAMARLADDDPAAAREMIGAAVTRWQQSGYSVQHWQAVAHEIYVDLYVDDAAGAHRRMQEAWRNLKRSLLLRGVAIRIPARFILATAAIASVTGSRSPEGERRIAEARRQARRLAAEAEPWGSVAASLVEAAADNAVGNREGAIANLRVAIAGAEAMRTVVYVRPARHRLGLLLGGEEGRRMTAEVVAECAAEGIRDPERWMQMHLPGKWRS
ncbi:MAG TPA: protein kinase [Polyangiaceae bacterium]|nr:protein kinase [Polyangiaceae bacterium]